MYFFYDDGSELWYIGSNVPGYHLWINASSMVLRFRSRVCTILDKSKTAYLFN